MIREMKTIVRFLLCRNKGIIDEKHTDDDQFLRFRFNKKAWMCRGKWHP